MIKRISHIVLSAWLAILLLFGGTSKEFIHLFSGHEDTIHSNIVHDGLTIEPEHHHCSFLQFTLTPYLNDVQTVVLPVYEIQYPQHSADVVCHIAHRSVITPLLRGPPSFSTFLS